MDLPKNAYFQGKIVPYSEAKVGVATHALNYGTAVFGGIRGYWNEEKERLFIFRPLDHFRRFLNSCRMMCMEVKHTPESLTDLTLELLRRMPTSRIFTSDHWHIKRRKGSAYACTT